MPIRVVRLWVFLLLVFLLLVFLLLVLMAKRVVWVNLLKRCYSGRYSVHAGLGYGTGGAEVSWDVGAAMQFGSN